MNNLFSILFSFQILLLLKNKFLNKNPIEDNFSFVNCNSSESR